MKKLINDSRNVVPEMLDGLVRLHPDLKLLSEALTLLRTGDPNEVAIVSGGGAGHARSRVPRVLVSNSRRIASSLDSASMENAVYGVCRRRELRHYAEKCSTSFDTAYDLERVIVSH